VPRAGQASVNLLDEYFVGLQDEIGADDCLEEVKKP